jgi:hypothetical protein
MSKQGAHGEFEGLEILRNVIRRHHGLSADEEFANA